jgi:AraC family transcriptional regulator, arabinose operon regulatory protein
MGPNRVTTVSGRAKGEPAQWQEALLPRASVEMALRKQPLLRGLLATGAGYCPKAGGKGWRGGQAEDQATLVYCIKGGGWCELGGQLHPVRPGDLLVLPPGPPHSYGAHSSNPWTIHYVHATGANLRQYLSELGVPATAPVRSIGVELEWTLLFNEVRRSLAAGNLYANWLQASHALAHLLALLIARRHEQVPHASSDVAKKVAQCIIYMSEHLDRPMRVSELAALANLSPTHFAVLFKQQAGCSPRDYLRLLRIHSARQLLNDSELSVKEIAVRIGYEDPFHFSRQFKAFQGVSPNAYRQARRG